MTIPTDTAEGDEARELRRSALETLERLLVTLTPAEAQVMRLRLGDPHFSTKHIHSIEDFARHFHQTVDGVLAWERSAIQKLQLQHSGLPDRLREVGLNPRTFGLPESGVALGVPEGAQLELVREVVETITQLTPELLAHLHKHHDSIELIPPEVFEHLIAELLASWGWDEVRRVGRNSETSADILAGYFDHRLGERHRYFIEVKRWRSKVGIEVVNQVLGAMLDERPRFGWHAAMIVTVAGSKNLRKYSSEELALKGIWIKDKADLIRWIQDYKPSPSGLWLPNSTAKGKK